MTLPQVEALMRFWRQTPPPALALKRISLFVGLKPERDAPELISKPSEAYAAVVAAGLPPTQGRPNDPMLDVAGW